MASAFTILQIRWRYLAVDKTHVAAITKMKPIISVQHLSIARKWIVVDTSVGEY
jgi:hypothetical protein